MAPAENMDNRLRYLLQAVPELLWVEHDPNDPGYYRVQLQGGKRYIYIVFEEWEMYNRADYSTFVEYDNEEEAAENTWCGGHTIQQIDDAVAIWGWPDLLGMEEFVAENERFAIYRTDIQSEEGSIQSEFLDQHVGLERFFNNQSVRVNQGLYEGETDTESESE